MTNVRPSMADEREMIFLLSQLDEDGQQKAGELGEEELEMIFSKLPLRTVPFFNGRIQAAINKRAASQ